MPLNFTIPTTINIRRFRAGKPGSCVLCILFYNIQVKGIFLRNIGEKETRFIVTASAFGVVAIVLLVWLSGVFKIDFSKYSKKNVMKIIRSEQVINQTEKDAIIDALSKTKDVYSDEEKLKIINALNKK
jgi:hypothetical protein